MSYKAPAKTLKKLGFKFYKEAFYDFSSQEHVDEWMLQLSDMLSIVYSPNSKKNKWYLSSYAEFVGDLTIKDQEDLEKYISYHQ